MTVESTPRPERQFARDRLPWVVGAAALAVYLVTLNHGVTLSSLALADRITGWDWQPTLYQPLLFLLTYPFRWLPAGWVPLALNGLTAVCASLTLALLARSVALLPHDRLEQQRLLVQNEYSLLSLPNAWVPAVLATVALGLQMTFWENAIAATGEMLDLLLFAYVIRCLLEHRIQPQQSWLGRATLVFGAAMANNWAMVGFLPLFLMALLRFRRRHWFNFSSRRRKEPSGEQSAIPGLAAGPRPLVRLSQNGDAFKVDAGQVATELRFLLRMALLGLAGLSLFLVLPLVQTFSPDSALSFWQALHATAGAHKATLNGFFGVFLRQHRDVALLLAATSLLPVLLLSIRWGSAALGGSQARADLTMLVLHLTHVFLLLICVWAMFDPPFSSRQIALRFGLPMAFLPLYYLCALSIGYYSGCFLLLFGADARQRLRRRAIFHRAACRTVPKLVYVLAGLTLAGLVLKNAPAIRAASSQYLDQFARLAVASLPPEGAVVLSDDSGRLAILQVELAREGKSALYPLVGTRALPFPTYRAWLRRRYPGRWPNPQAELQPAPGSPAASVTNAPLEAVGPLQLLSHLVRSNRVFCVEPGFGLMIEQFYAQPHGLLQEIKFYPANSLSGPLPSSAELAEDEAFWKRAIETGVNPLLRLVAEPELPRPSFEKPLMELGHLETPPPIQAKVLARWYSGALNRWGVTLQRNARTGEAAHCFALAQELNVDNFPARLNLQCSSNLLARQEMTVTRDRSFQDRFGAYQTWNQILIDNGPFDEPSYCYQWGLGLAGAGMLRQAGQQFERVAALAPGDHAARLMLGEIYCRIELPDQALQTAAEIRADPKLQPLGPTNEVDVAILEAEAWFTKTNRTKAEGIINSLLIAHPEDSGLLGRAEAIFIMYKSYSNALQIVERQLQAAPDNPFALIDKGVIHLLYGDFSNAIPPFTRSLELTNTPAARLYRAHAYVQTGRLDAAEADYQELLRAYPAAYRAYNGLGEIAWQRKDTNAAIRYYQQYLSNTVARTEESSAAVARLKALQPSRH
jgi:tetratricopeptide (TPR) repeat protein